jgi:hypothetical protein
MAGTAKETPAMHVSVFRIFIMSPTISMPLDGALSQIKPA